jgi:serine/threonine protein kinase
MLIFVNRSISPPHPYNIRCSIFTAKHVPRVIRSSRGAYSEEEHLSPVKTLRVVRQVAAACAYLHSVPPNGIVHRDLKSQNILIDRRYNAKVWANRQSLQPSRRKCTGEFTGLMYEQLVTSYLLKDLQYTCMGEQSTRFHWKIRRIIYGQTVRVLTHHNRGNTLSRVLA